MLTNNWYWATLAIVSKNTIRNVIVKTDGGIADASYGNSQNYNIYPATFLWTSNLFGATGSGWLFGSGTTEAKATDHFLENYIPYTNFTLTIVQSGNGISKLTLTNKSGNDITVGEVGLVQAIYTSPTSTAQALFLREVLNEPITLGAGEAGIIDVSFSLTIPDEE